MIVRPAPLDGVLVIEPDAYGDERGYILETWNRERYRAIGLDTDFAQDNLSRSSRGVLRGLHYQFVRPQGKLVSTPEGVVFDVAVDLRRGSPTFGQWWGCILSAASHRQMWIPPGFAHGFLVLSEHALVAYKCTEPYEPAANRAVAWNDPAIGIAWPAEPTTLSEKDRAAPLLRDIPAHELPEDPAAENSGSKRPRGVTQPAS